MENLFSFNCPTMDECVKRHQMASLYVAVHRQRGLINSEQFCFCCRLFYFLTSCFVQIAHIGIKQIAPNDWSHENSNNRWNHRSITWFDDVWSANILPQDDYTHHVFGNIRERNDMEMQSEWQFDANLWGFCYCFRISSLKHWAHGDIFETVKQICFFRCAVMAIELIV